ncbi:O-methylsterigmatocystin oxidoreductase [Coprinopsis cinerea okayama7|uniref:O-methylsterigmatocystin oxidoreductase n=1 Tax=Coprinopsis cinerea (strain Okayama-7 / 130 / ATCC MYA-4618 / FGSC 9003) TaxID=240176 RepID=D6RLY3_COPC7|nr:O-methylsterigmatocystin oxidoreductase [Coprinopsis cinerea okayama7\|eukprot:XP_002911348.1 O-methylsterigmatocystin oxidoreductase [Coprinopsis cinerea okayama7\
MSSLLAEIPLPTVLYAVSIVVALGLMFRNRKEALQPPKPPGPKGDVLYLEALGQSLLILSSRKRITELMDKRSTIYSDRPPFPMFHLMNYGHYITIMPYGNTWKQHRKTFHQQLDAHISSTWHDLMVKNTKSYLKRLLTCPEKWGAHTKHGLIIEVTYGVETESPTEEFVKYTNEVSVGFGSAALPGSFLVDNIPLLKYVPSWFPGAGFKRFAAYHGEVAQRAKHRPYNHVLKKIKEGTLPTCMVSNMLEEGTHDDLARNVATIAHIAGTDTVRLRLPLEGYALAADMLQSMGTALAFLNFIAMHPDVQRKAQRELDDVVGQGRLPGFSDRDNLVYIEAILRESLRVHQTFPMGRNSACDYKHIMHDPEIYQDPMTFKPERFIKDGKIDGSILDPSDIVFGICPGSNFSRDSLFIMIAYILTFFDVEPTKDETGKPDIRYEPEDKGVSHPEPFDVVFKPRSKEHESLLRSL